MVDWNTCLQRFEARTAALHPRVKPDDFRHAIIVSSRYNYLYVNVPKAACTTIRKLLIDAEFGEVRPYAERSDALHYNEFLPFLNVWQLERSHRPEEDIFFAEFVKTVCTTPPSYQNAHWRPQYDQTFQEGLTYDLIGRPGEGSRHHATGAGAQVKTYFTEELRKLVYTTYRKDFDTFGYSTHL